MDLSNYAGAIMVCLIVVFVVLGLGVHILNGNVGIYSIMAIIGLWIGVKLVDLAGVEDSMVDIVTKMYVGSLILPVIYFFNVLTKYVREKKRLIQVKKMEEERERIDREIKLEKEMLSEKEKELLKSKSVIHLTKLIEKCDNSNYLFASEELINVREQINELQNLKKYIGELENDFSNLQ